MDAAKVDLVLQYALAIAAEAEDPFDRRLGKIHLIKYVYLADLAYSEKHGATFTGASWRFYHYGPWDLAVHNRIAPVLALLCAHEFVWTSTKYESDSVRWSISGDEAPALVSELDRRLPVIVSLAVKRAVSEFYGDTSSLLHRVYTTDPMLHAAPNQTLVFSFAKSNEPAADSAPEALSKTHTTKDLKRRKEAMRDVREKFKAAVAAPLARGRKPPVIKPIYDDLFADGSREIEALAGSPPDGLAGNAAISDDVWTSEVRTRGRLP